VNFLIAGYAYTQGAVPFDSALPIKNAQLKTQSAVLAYANCGLLARTGNSYDLLGIAWQYRWGAGL